MLLLVLKMLMMTWNLFIIKSVIGSSIMTLISTTTIVITITIFIWAIKCLLADNVWIFRKIRMCVIFWRNSKVSPKYAAQLLKKAENSCQMNILVTISKLLSSYLYSFIRNPIKFNPNHIHIFFHQNVLKVYRKSNKNKILLRNSNFSDFSHIYRENVPRTISMSLQFSSKLHT